MASTEKLIRIILRADDQMSATMDRAASSIDRVGATMRRVGAGLTAGVTVPIVAGFAAATKSAIDFETAFTGVTKTVDDTAAGYEQLRADLIGLATDTDNAVSALENAPIKLMNIAEAAGQLGVSRENIVGFTEVLGELEMATNIVGEEGARDLAKFAAATDFDLANVRNLGDTIVDLGNNFATTERDLLQFGKRMATVSQNGFKTDQILAYGAVMDELGLTAELAGTNFVKAVDTMTIAAARGGDDLATFSQVADMTQRSFKQLVDSDPSAALQRFVEGLDALPVEQQVAALESLGLQGQEAQRVLRTLAAGNDQLADALARANTAMQGSNALQQEALKRADTAQGAINAFRNNLQAFGAEVGQNFLPTLKQFLGAMTNLMQAFMDLPAPVQRVLIVLSLLAAAVGPVLMVLGSMASGISAIAAAAPIMAAGIGSIATMAMTAAPALWAMMAPILPLILLIGAVVAALALVYKHRDRILNGLRSYGDAFQYLKEIVSKVAQKIGKFIGNLITGIRDKFNDVVQWLRGNAGRAFTGGLQAAFDAGLNMLKSLPQVFLDFGRRILQGLINGIKSKISEFVGTVENLANAAANAVRSALRIQSPSKVMMQLGVQAAEGLNQGFTNNTPFASTGAPRMQVSGASATGGAGGNVYINKLIAAPGTTEEQARDIMRQIGREIKRKGGSGIR